MKITWLGQAGLLFEYDNVKIMIDPYLSDSCLELNPSNRRRTPIREEIFDISPDVFIVTHCHRDHLDPETYPRFLDTDKSITVLAPENSWTEIRKYGKNHNYVMFNTGTTWTEYGISFHAVRAEHSDSTAIGVIIDDNKNRFYITGDTLLNDSVIAGISGRIDAVFLPINGVGNNMNMQDAATFVKAIGAKKCVPIHWGMFDELNPDNFPAEKMVIPRAYHEIKL